MNANSSIKEELQRDVDMIKSLMKATEIWKERVEQRKLEDAKRFLAKVVLLEPGDSLLD